MVMHCESKEDTLLEMTLTSMGCTFHHFHCLLVWQHLALRNHCIMGATDNTGLQFWNYSCRMNLHSIVHFDVNFQFVSLPRMVASCSKKP